MHEKRIESATTNQREAKNSNTFATKQHVANENILTCIANKILASKIYNGQNKLKTNAKRHIYINTYIYNIVSS